MLEEYIIVELERQMCILLLGSGIIVLNIDPVRIIKVLSFGTV